MARTVAEMLRLRAMRSYEAQATIERPARTPIWAVLTDAPGYAAWDSASNGSRARSRRARRSRSTRKANPGRAFPVKVTEFQPGQRHDVVRRHAARPVQGRADVHPRARATAARPGSMREEYTGPLLPLIWRTMPDLGPSFEQFARGLKARVETAPMP